MSSDIRRLLWGTRERLISTDLNNSTDLLHRALIEGLYASMGPDTAVYGVLRGLTVSVVSSTLTVTVNPGVALMSGTAPTSYDSDVEWVELRAAEVVDLSSYVDGANPRWVVIEMAANDGLEASSTRDQFIPSTGAFNSVSFEKIRGSDPTITVTAGTPAASPVLPSGTAGRIPLAYVYIEASASQLTVGDTIGCRPLLRKGPEATSLRGGGVGVPANGSNVDLSTMTARLDGIGFDLGLGPVSGLDIGTTNDLFVDGESYPAGAVNDILYLYAITAPYPTGYDAALAPREFVPGVNIGPGARIPSLPAAVADAVTNCIVVASTTAPTSANDADGTTLTDGAPNDGFWGATTIATRSVYLGACLYASGLTDLVPQISAGPLTEFVPASTIHIPLGSDGQSSNTVTNQSGNFRLEDPLAESGDQLIPDSATRFIVHISTSGGASTAGYAALETDGTSAVVFRNEYINGQEVSRVDIASPDGDFEWSNSETGGTTGTVTLITYGYVDDYLARR